MEEREVSAAPVANINRTDCQLGGAVGCNATENEAGPCILLCMGYDIVIFSEKINVSTRANKCDVMDIKAANDTTTFA